MQIGKISEPSLKRSVLRPLFGDPAAIQDRAYFEETRAKIIATRERTKQRMAELGFTFGDSKANFLFVHCVTCLQIIPSAD